MHNRYNSGVITQGISYCLRLNQTMLIGIEISHLKAFALQLTTGVQNCLVFNFRGNNMLALTGVKVSTAFDCQIISLSCSRGPDNLSRVCANKTSNIGASIFDRRLRLPTKHMRTRCWITEVTRRRKKFYHLISNRWINWGCRSVIQVNWKIHSFLQD